MKKSAFLSLLKSVVKEAVREETERLEQVLLESSRPIKATSTVTEYNQAESSHKDQKRKPLGSIDSLLEQTRQEMGKEDFSNFSTGEVSEGTQPRELSFNSSDAKHYNSSQPQNQQEPVPGLSMEELQRAGQIFKKSLEKSPHR